jgi:hypothetical protein
MFLNRIYIQCFGKIEVGEEEVEVLKLLTVELLRAHILE